MKVKLIFKGWQKKNVPNAQIEPGTDWLIPGFILEGIVELDPETQEELEFYEAEGKEAVFTLIKGE
jgi:hypothetical protein